MCRKNRIKEQLKPTTNALSVENHNKGRKRTGELEKKKAAGRRAQVDLRGRREKPRGPTRLPSREPRRRLIYGFKFYPVFQERRRPLKVADRGGGSVFCYGIKEGKNKEVGGE